MTVGQACSSIISNIGIYSQQNQTEVDAASNVYSAAQNQQSSVSGVSMDEEAVNLITYQQIYEANLKVISAGPRFSIRCWKCAAKRERENESNFTQQTYVSMTQSFNNRSGNMAHVVEQIGNRQADFAAVHEPDRRHADRPVKPPAVGD